MMRSLFGRGKKKPEPRGQSAGESIRDARVGDVVVVQGLDLDYDEVYFLVENLHRYGGNGIIWYELVLADAEKKVWLEWVDDGGELYVTATDDRTPVAPDAIGLTEADLMTLDEEHSIANYVTLDGVQYFYRNSFEAFYFKDNQAVGEGFYLWDLLSEDGQRTLSVSKFEGTPFEAHFSESLSPDDIILYPGERLERRNR